MDQDSILSGFQRLIVCLHSYRGQNRCASNVDRLKKPSNDGVPKFGAGLIHCWSIGLEIVFEERRDDQFGLFLLILSCEHISHQQY